MLGDIALSRFPKSHQIHNSQDPNYSVIKSICWTLEVNLSRIFLEKRRMKAKDHPSFIGVYKQKCDKKLCLWIRNISKNIFWPKYNVKMPEVSNLGNNP